MARRAAGGTIGQRMARILALPATVILVLLAVVSSEQIQNYRSSQSTSRSVQLTLAVQGLVNQLQAERGVTAGVLGGNPSFRSELAASRQQVDQQRAAVEALVQGGGPIEAQVRTALQQLDGLPAVRAATDAATAGRAAMFAYFTARIANLEGVDVGLDSATDQQLRRGASALQALEDLSEATAQERAFLNGVFSAGAFGPGEFIQFAAMRTAKDAALARFDAFATPSEAAAGRFVFDTGAARETAYFEQVALDAADGRHIVVNPQSWWSGLTTVLDDVRQLQDNVGSVIQIRAHDLQQSAAQRIAELVAAVLVCLVGSVVVAAIASLSITRPLAALAAEADDVATDRLPSAVSRVQAGGEDESRAPPSPVQVPPRATKEIRSVATALDRLQSAAYGLATEQAAQRLRTIESLANLGRRNQNLIRRQLGFITTLEREEIDPAALANLFELDHLATRMRRNAASLLVLVGASSPRQWSSPVPIADVIRAAVSEVEEYRRVSLRRVDDALVIGTAVGSVAHLLSELIENGLTFSPPDTEVEIQGRAVGDGYLIAITDQGIGMDAIDLREANARLRGEGDFIAAPTRFLGHFVVGELARDLSIDVELVPSPVVGVTARATLPASVLGALLAVEQATHPQAAIGTRPSVSLLEVPARLAARPLALSSVQGGLAAPREAGSDGAGSHGAGSHGAGSHGAGSDGAGSHGAGSHGAAASTGGLPLMRPGAAARYDAAPAAGTGSVPVATGDPLAPREEPSLFEPPWGGPAEQDPGSAADSWPFGPESSGSGSPGSGGSGPGGFGPGGLGSSSGGSGSGGSGAGGSDPDRTRNGLRKRIPRGQRAADLTGPLPAHRVIDLDAADRAATVDDSPAQVRARLTSLRAGMERGQGLRVPSGSGPERAARSDHDEQERQ
jgi:anti-sigma regulatory factor (Ser/Thr protein kinase)